MINKVIEMLSIRKYEKKDYEDVRYVCLNSDGEAITGSTGEFILLTYCDYYIENEPENCFVLDDDGKAVGYIICTENFDNFNEIFRKNYLPRVKPLGENLYTWSQDSVLLQNKHKASYPAHMHIDLLPPYHRQGWGGKLLHTLFDHLKSKGIRGVMLTAGVDNRNARSFYTKYGFEEIEIYQTDVAFGMKLL